jgi:hypothetical protein
MIFYILLAIFIAALAVDVFYLSRRYRDKGGMLSFFTFFGVLLGVGIMATVSSNNRHVEVTETPLTSLAADLGGDNNILVSIYSADQTITYSTEGRVQQLTDSFDVQYGHSNYLETRTKVADNPWLVPWKLRSAPEYTFFVQAPEQIKYVLAGQ